MRTKKDLVGIPDFSLTNAYSHIWSILEKILSNNVAFSALRFFPPPVRNVQSLFYRTLSLMRPLPKVPKATSTNIHSNRRVTNKLNLKFEPNKKRNGKVISTSFTLSYRILTLIGPLPKNGESYLNHIYSNLKVTNEVYFKFGPNWTRNGKVIAIISRKTCFPVFTRQGMKCPNSLILRIP